MNRKQQNDMPPEALTFYIDHPVEFAQDLVLKLTPEELRANKVGRRIEPEQIELMNAVAKSDRVAVRSGHGIGKTFSLACLALWFIYTREHAKVIITGPKFDQLKNTVWSQLGLLYANSGVFSDEFEFGAERLSRRGTKQHPEYPTSWAAWIVTAKAPESLQGLHAAHMLVVADEASAEELDKIQEALLSCLTTGYDNRYLMIGNPTRTIGAFYDAFHSKRKWWDQLHFNSENSAIVGERWLQEKREMHHPDSPVYMVRVKGEFPPSNPRSIISLADINAAMEREVTVGDFLELGVDPALEGDDLAVIGVRQGNVVVDLRAFPKTTPMELNRHVITCVREWRDKTGIKSKIKIKVDAHGGYGSTLIEFLTLNTEDNVEVMPIYSNSAATNIEYKNYGTQMWFELNAHLKNVQLPHDDLLAEELCGREWRPADMTVITIEPKVEFKKRLGRSPDKADAVVLAFAGGDKKVFSRKEYGENTVRPFDVDWDQRRVFDPTFTGATTLDILHYVSLVVSKDLTVYGIGAIYEFYRNKLWVYNEFRLPIPIAQEMASVLKERFNYGRYPDCRNPLVIGNELMFKDEGERHSIATVLRRECNVLVRETVRYDEFGALSLGAQMFDNSDVIVHTNCKMSLMQLNSWSVKTKIKDDDMGFGKALLLTLSEIRRKAKPQPQLVAMPDYRKAGPAVPENAGPRNPNRWMAR